MKNWSLPVKVERLLLKNDLKGALFLLSRITALNSKDFRDHDTDYLKFVGQFRIELLIENYMYREALAWVCLQCELYPEEIRYHILKESLKRSIVNLPGEQANKIAKERSWNDIAGMYDLKAIIERDIIRPIQEYELYQKFKVEIPNGFMFYGPPGCGKTFFAKKIAEKLDFNFIAIKTSDIASTYVHGTQQEIKKVFEVARKQIPVVLFFDEMEAMAPSRNSTDVSHHYKSEVDEFLAQLDKQRNKGVIIIGATNYLNRIDKAVLRTGRFDRHIFIGPPDMVARGEAFRLFLKDFPQKNIRFDFIAEISKNFTYADIERVCNDVKMEALQKKLTSIDTNIIGSHVTRFKPKLSDEELQKYFE